MSRTSVRPTRRTPAGNAGVALALVVALLCVADAQGVAFRYHWTQDAVVTYQTTLHTTSTVSGTPGMGDVSFDQTMTQRIRLLAAAVSPDGSAILHQTIDAVRVEMNTPTGSRKYDSADPKSAEVDPASDAMAKVFGGLIGATISVAMGPDGAIQRIEGAQKALDKITQDLPRDRSTAGIAQSLKGVLSDEAIRASLEQSFPRLPSKPVQPGDTWTGQVSLGSGGMGRILGAQTFTLKSTSADGLATIGVALVMKQESAPPIGPQGMTVTLGESHGEGELVFDVTNGRLRKATMQTEMPSTMTTTGPDGRPAILKNLTKTSMTMEIVQ